MRNFLVSLLFFIFLAGISVGFFFYNQIEDLRIQKELQKKAPQPDKNEDNLVITEEATKSADLTYDKDNVIKETPCYTIVIPKDNDADNGDNCKLSYNAYISSGKGTDISAGITIVTEEKTYKNPKDMADKLIAELKRTDETTIQAIALTIDKQPAYEIRTKNALNGLETTRIFISMPKKYKIDKKFIGGFIVIRVYSEPESITEQKKELERLLKSWKWK